MTLWRDSFSLLYLPSLTFASLTFASLIFVSLIFPSLTWDLLLSEVRETEFTDRKQYNTGQQFLFIVIIDASGRLCVWERMKEGREQEVRVRRKRGEGERRKRGETGRTSVTSCVWSLCSRFLPFFLFSSFPVIVQ